MKKSAGFSLIELMITVVIIAIVTSIALPSYREHVKRTMRTDAMTALLRLAAEQEKFYIANNSYTDDLGDLNITGTDEGLYKLEIDNSTDLTLAFTATATAKAGESQENDDNCEIFTIDSNGNRSASGGGSDNTEFCWK